VGCFEITFDKMKEIITKEYLEYEVFINHAKKMITKDAEILGYLEKLCTECKDEMNDSIRCADNYYR
jgi:hypothetical protein